MRDDGTDDTMAAPPPPLARGTTRGTDPTVDAGLVPPGQVTRASSPSLQQVAGKADHDALPVVDPANYQIVKELARGGMGRILEARDLRLGRPIAIKEVLHADETGRARFDREVRITARLQHPAIVHVTEAGQWPTGQPFFAMKLIRGKPLDVRIGAAKDLGERLALLPAVIAVVDALAYAHSKSVIHRDLKPANVLVGDFGETVVIDWGIAKNLAEQDELVSLPPERRQASDGGETIEGSVIGTPSYMPPEQAAGERVDERADVYALGALLYQVLAGVPPFVGRTTAEVLTKVIDQAPEPLARLAPDAPADLIAIVEKAMSRERDQRFPTANEMVIELKRFQQGKLVASHDYTLWELARRFLHRNRAAVAVGAIAVVTLVVLGGFGISRIVAEQHRADVEAMQARVQNDGKLISEARLALDTDPTRALALLKQLSPDTAELRSARLVASDAAHRGVAHVLVAGGQITHLAFSPDSRTLVSYEAPGGTVRVWDLETWTGRPLGGAPDVIGVGMHGDAVHAVDARGRIWRWSATASAPRPPTLVRTLSGHMDKALFSPDGTKILISGVESLDDRYRPDQLRLVDLGTEERVLGRHQHASWALDSKTFAVYNRAGGGEVGVFDATTTGYRVHGTAIHSPALATDGTRVWIAPYARQREPTALVDLATGTRVPIPAQPMLLAPLPGGGAVASTSTPRFRSLADTTYGRDKGEFVQFHREEISIGEHALLVSDGWPGNVVKLIGHATAIESLATSRTGLIASGDHEGTIRVWKVPAIARDRGDGQTTASQAMLLDDDELVITQRGPTLAIHDLMTGARRTLEITDLPPGYTRDLTTRTERNTRMGDRYIRESYVGPGHEVITMSRSEDRKTLATLDTGDQAVIWDLTAGRGKILSGEIVHLALDLDGRRVATSRKTGDAMGDRVLEIWDLQTGKATQLGELAATAMAFGRGDRLAVASLAPALWLFERGKPRLLREDQLQNYRALAFSPDGKKLYAGTENWFVEVFDLETGTHATWRGHMGSVIGLLVSPDGERVFSASADNTVRVWNVADGSSFVLRDHRDLVTSMQLGVDDTLITASLDRSARIWDLQAGHSRALTGHEDRVVFAAHIANGQRVVVVDRYRQIAEYADNLPFQHHLFRAWLDTATNVTRKDY